jgi:hypothetical protein
LAVSTEPPPTDCVLLCPLLRALTGSVGNFVHVPLFGFAEHTPKRAECIVMVRRRPER